ncbi:MAG: VOC family protein [Brevirhabdus sp.]
MERHGMIWWSELMTRDVEAAVSYYAKICGWQFEAVPMQDGDGGAFTYHVAMNGGMPVAGISDIGSMHDDSGRAPYWFTYIAVNDLDAALAETVSGGGKVMRPPFEVPGTGWIATVVDPSGAEIGLMTPDVMPDDVPG